MKNKDIIECQQCILQKQFQTKNEIDQIICHKCVLQQLINEEAQLPIEDLLLYSENQKDDLQQWSELEQREIQQINQKTNNLQILEDNQNNLIGQYNKLQRINGIIYCCAITMSKDILIAANKNQILVWKMVNGLFTLNQILDDHTSQIRCLLFFKKHNKFISGGNDTILRIWEFKDVWSCSEVLDGHEDSIIDVVLNYEEDQLISWGKDQLIKVWTKQETWVCIQTINNDQILALSLSPECNQFASINYSEMRIWEQQKHIWKLKQVIKKPQNDEFKSVSFIKEKEIIAITGQIRKARIYRIIKLNYGQFKIQESLLLNWFSQQNYLHPVILGQSSELSLCRHDIWKMYILTKQGNQYQLHSVFGEKFQGRNMSPDRKILVLADINKEAIDIFMLKTE